MRLAECIDYVACEILKPVLPRSARWPRQYLAAAAKGRFRLLLCISANAESLIAHQTQQAPGCSFMPALLATMTMVSDYAKLQRVKHSNYSRLQCSIPRPMHLQSQMAHPLSLHETCGAAAVLYGFRQWYTCQASAAHNSAMTSNGANVHGCSPRR